MKQRMKTFCFQSYAFCKADECDLVVIQILCSRSLSFTFPFLYGVGASEKGFLCSSIMAKSLYIR